MRSYILSKKIANKIAEKIRRDWPTNPVFEAKNIRIVEINSEESILLGKEFISVKIGEYILPFLGTEKYLEKFSKIIVDSGAIKYVCRGAKVMRPGIINWEGEFRKGDIVSVEDGKYRKRLAIGIALVDSSELVKISKGEIIDNLHYVGDKFWETNKHL